MNVSEEVKCPYCNKVFFLHSFRLRHSKSTNCFHCKKRITNLEVHKR